MILKNQMASLIHQNEIDQFQKWIERNFSPISQNIFIQVITDAAKTTDLQKVRPIVNVT